MLDEHYGIVMMFDTLSKEFYSLKQGSGENVAKFRLCLSQQVQILQSEYLARIQPEHMEEMKCDCFCEGLNPNYQQMLAHKMDGEHPTGYSDLLLVAQMLERWAEARDPLLSKITTAGRLNMTCSQTPGNLFPSHKLKGNCTFTAQSATVENNKAEEDSGVKPEGEEEAESTAGEDVETSNKGEEADQSVGYIVCCANAVELYQNKNQNFGCSSPDHQKTSVRPPRKWV